MRKPSFFYFVILLMLLPLPVFADDESEDSAELLGWIAVGCGVVANIPFITINKYRKYAIAAGGMSFAMARNIGIHFKTILNFHIMFNSIGYFAEEKGGEVHEMDVPPCNPLLDLRFVTLVLSKTLNGSSVERKRI